jgi:two-component system, NarL family, nitrate/nitrite response regulator NarL
MMGWPIRILILDDHSLFREGLARMLNTEEGLTVAGSCSTADEAISILSSTAVDVMLLDYDLGKELATDFLKSLAVLRTMPRTLIVTAGMTDKARSEALSLGAIGIVLKHSNPEHLIAAVRKAMATEEPERIDIQSSGATSGYDPSMPTSLCHRPLTRRQASALRGILDGLGNREIGEKMNLSESSVKAIIQELFHKAGVRTRSQLVRVAIEKHSADWIG